MMTLKVLMVLAVQEVLVVPVIQAVLKILLMVQKEEVIIITV
jgi:hypothetical protein